MQLSKVSIYSCDWNWVSVLIRFTLLTLCLASSLSMSSSVWLGKFRYLTVLFDELRILCSLAIIFVL